MFSDFIHIYNKNKMNKKFKVKDVKKFPSTTGIYSIGFKNSKSNKIYIGSASKTSGNLRAKGFCGRWQKHLHSLRNDKHHSISLQNSYNKHGESNIVFIVLEECDSNLCIIREQFYIDSYDSYNNGHNGRPNASSNLGFKQNENFKKAIYDKYKKIRDSYYEEVNELYKKNKTTREISKILNISRGMISKIFKENDIQGKNTAYYKKKKLFQYKMDGKFIKKWDNINSCCYSLGIKSNTVRDVLRGRSRHSKNFYFSLKKLTSKEVRNNINLLVIKSKNRKYFNINQYDENNNYIKTWRDVREIVEHYNFSNTKGITESIRKENKYKGFYWVCKM